MMSALIGTLMFVTAIFLILLVLVQRGRGGGLTGALGGMGGQSAFGTKAGDLFTKITMYVATFWILLCIAAILLLNRQVRPTLTGSNGSPEFTTTVPADASNAQPGSPAGAGAVPAESPAPAAQPAAAAPPATPAAPAANPPAEKPGDGS